MLKLVSKINSYLNSDEMILIFLDSGWVKQPEDVHKSS